MTVGDRAERPPERRDVPRRQPRRPRSHVPETGGLALACVLDLSIAS